MLMSSAVGFDTVPADADSGNPAGFQDRIVSKEPAMVERKQANKPTTNSIDTAARDTGSENTLLPMLIGGLVLVVVGAIVVMMFV